MVTTCSEPAQTSAQGGHLRLIDVTGAAPDVGMRELINAAVRIRASDLFLVTNEQHVAVQVRYLGMVEPLAILDREQGQRYIAHLRALTGLADPRRPQDGRWMFQTDEQLPIDLRVSIVPTLWGDDLAMRLLVRDANLMSLDRLGMLRQQLDGYRGMLDRPGGMILLTGPTGSGKTVTLYASLNYLNDGHRKIHTIEDPVEYAVDGLRQSQVNPAIELGHAELLRGVLRQSPDVIMIGEIRDAETAETAVWAANSGVLVLSTIHAPSAAEAIQSLRGFGVPAAFISTSLRGVVNVRLVRTLCPVCREAVATGEEARQHFREIESRLNPGDGTLRFAAHGCDQCHQTGYGGRVGIFEVMPVSDNVRDMILKGRSARQIRARAYQEGVLTLREAALMKAAQGLTTLEEVRRIIPGPQRLPQGEKKGAKSIDGEYPTDGEAAATTLARG